jgi:hypothetical protein
VTEEGLLEALASVAHSPSGPLSALLLTLRTTAVADSTLAVVIPPPPPAEVASLTRVGSAFGPKVAVMIYPTDPATLPPDRRALLEAQATTAQLSLARAGWDVFLIGPHGRLLDVWHANRKKLPAGTD